jgi:hypothetical protein
VNDRSRLARVNEGKAVWGGDRQDLLGMAKRVAPNEVQAEFL